MEKQKNLMERLERNALTKVEKAFLERFKSLDTQYLTSTTYLKLDYFALAMYVSVNKELFETNKYDYESALLTIGKDSGITQKQMETNIKTLNTLHNKTFESVQEYIKFILNSEDKSKLDLSWLNLENMATIAVSDLLDKSEEEKYSKIKYILSQKQVNYLFEILTKLSIFQSIEDNSISTEDFKSTMELQQADMLQRHQEEQAQQEAFISEMYEKFKGSYGEHQKECNNCQNLDMPDTFEDFKNMPEEDNTLNEISKCPQFNKQFQGGAKDPGDSSGGTSGVF